MSSYTDTTPAPCGAGVVFALDIDQLPRQMLESAIRAAALILPFDAITPAALKALLDYDRQTLEPLYDTCQLYEDNGLVGGLVRYVMNERRYMITESLFVIVSQLANEMSRDVEFTFDSAVGTLPYTHPLVRYALRSVFREQECRVAMQRFVATTPAPAVPVQGSLPVQVSFRHQVKTYYTYFCMTYPSSEFTERTLLSLALDTNDARRGKFLPPRLLPPAFFGNYAAVSFAQQNTWFTQFVNANLTNKRNALVSFIARAFSIIFPCMMVAIERNVFTCERAVTWYLEYDVIRKRYMPITVFAQVARIMVYFQHNTEQWIDSALEEALMSGAPTDGLHRFNTPGMRTIVRQYVKLKMKRKRAVY